MATVIVKATVDGTVWAHSAGLGQYVFAGNPIMILESMKMEVPVDAPVDGEIVSICPTGQQVSAGGEVAKLETRD
jgi:biotin carboxyl carrier protein